MISIRRTSDQDHAEIVAIRNRINLDRMARNVKDFRSAIRSQPPEAFAQSYVAEAGGKLAGHLWLNRLIYVPGPHVWYAEIQVHPELQRQGIGSRLYQFLLDRLTEHRAEEVHAHVREDLPAARFFVRSRGFRETGHADRPSRLDVSAASTDAGRRAADRLTHEGIRITTLAELGESEGALRALHTLANETWADMPASEEFTFIPFEEWRRLRLEEGEQPDMVWVALDGERTVGLATLLPRPGSAAFHAHTGVARTHRGRGIARALKHHQVQWARRHGIEHLFTENDVENASMLRINTEMGYKPLPADVEVVKKITPSSAHEANTPFD